MTKYKCGHESNAVLLDDNELSVAAYVAWAGTMGYSGDCSECFACYCKKGRAGVEVKGAYMKAARDEIPRVLDANRLAIEYLSKKKDGV